MCLNDTYSIALFLERAVYDAWTLDGSRFHAAAVAFILMAPLDATVRDERIEEKPRRFKFRLRSRSRSMVTRPIVASLTRIHEENENQQDPWWC